MLLPPLGACVVVGPFRGPEWEPVQGLFSRHGSCRDPWCCCNLLVLCLFLIWQIRRYWYQVTRTCSSKRNAIKVPSQKWAVPSTRHETSFRTVPELLLTPGKIGDLDVHVHQRTPKQRWGYRWDLRQPWPRCLLPPQTSCQDLPWGVHISSEPIFCTSSFSSSCLFPQDSSWETWQVPRSLENSQAHPSPDTCQRKEQQQLVPSWETAVPAEPAVRMKGRPTSTTLPISLPNLHSAQSLKSCVREFLPDPPNQQVRMPTWKSWGSPPQPKAPWNESQMIDRRYSKESQALKCINQTESRREGAWEIQASGDQLPVNARMEDGAEAKTLRHRNQRLVICETGDENLTPVGENRVQKGVENRVQTGKSWKKTQGESGDSNPSSQAHMGRNQERLRSKTDTATQTAEWGKQDKSEGRTAAGTQASEKKSEKETRARQQDDAESQTPEWEKQRYTRNENEIPTPAGEEEWPRGGVQARKVQAAKRENQTLPRHAAQVLMKQFREIREEDWVVIQAPWWESQRLLVGEIHREFTVQCWGNQSQARGEYMAEVQAPEENDQRGDGKENIANTFTPEAENQGHVRGKAHVQTYSAERENKERNAENGTDTQACGKRNMGGGVKGEDTENQELAKEDQGLLGNEFLEKIHIPTWKDQEVIRGNTSKNTQAPEAETREELRSDAEIGAAESEKEEQVQGGYGTEIQMLALRILRIAGGESGVGAWAARKERQSHLRSEVGMRTHWSEWKNQAQEAGEGRVEVQAPEKRSQQALGGEHDAKTRTPERENGGQLESELGGSYSPGQSCWEPTGGENAATAENQASEKRNWRVAGSEDARKIQRLRRQKQKLLRSRVNGKSYYSSEWKNQRHFGRGNGAKTQIQRKRNPRRRTGGGSVKTQASARDDHGQSRRGSDGEMQKQRWGKQSKGADEGAAVPQDRRSQRKHGAESAGLSQAPGRRDKGLARGQDTAMASFQGDFSGAEGLTCRKYNLAQPPTLTVSGYGVLEPKQTVAVTGVDSPLCPERSPHPHWGEVLMLHGGKEGHLTSQGTARSWKPRTVVCPASQEPKGPVLKKSKQLLLESLMRRRAAHLRWGLPRRILESYLRFHFLEPCSLPQAGVRLSESSPHQELQRPGERRREGQSSLLGLSSAKRSQGVPALERKSSKLPNQARALEKRSEPMGNSIPGRTPRIRPPGGARASHMEEELPKGPVLASRNPRLASESPSWCGPGRRVREPSSKNSRARGMIRPGVSPMAEAERASSRAKVPISTTGPGGRRKEGALWGTLEPSKPHRQPTYWRNGSLEPEEDRRAWQPPSSWFGHASRTRGSVHSAATRLSMTLLNRMPWSPQPAKPRSSVPDLSLPHSRGDTIRGCTALGRDHQSRGHPGAGGPLPTTKSHQGQEAPGIPNGVLRNPPASQKFGLMKYLRCFLGQHGFKK
uniref:uncharacterized protein CUNH22orf46 n=1 Tax=Jaculus jaculus TaxID=51337 RepID=UPI001E1B3284|nr:uncharacterized protein CUNH22orf46 [Jaculus jaculus]